MTTLASLLSGSLPQYALYPEGEVPATPTRPYLVLVDGSPRIVGRRLDGRLPRADVTTDRVMVVSNRPGGCVAMARELCAIVDGWRPSPLIAPRVRLPQSQPLAEPTMTDGYRWSLNVEITYRSVRS